MASIVVIVDGTLQKVSGEPFAEEEYEQIRESFERWVQSQQLVYFGSMSLDDGD